MLFDNGQTLIFPGDMEWIGALFFDVSYRAVKGTHGKSGGTSNTTYIFGICEISIEKQTTCDDRILARCKRHFGPKWFLTVSLLLTWRSSRRKGE